MKTKKKKASFASVKLTAVRFDSVNQVRVHQPADWLPFTRLDLLCVCGLVSHCISIELSWHAPPTPFCLRLFCFFCYFFPFSINDSTEKKNQPHKRGGLGRSSCRGVWTGSDRLNARCEELKSGLNNVRITFPRKPKIH